jgi:hypothetical protein
MWIAKYPQEKEKTRGFTTYRAVETPHQSTEPFVLQNHSVPVQHTAVHALGVLLRLQFALQLQSDLGRLESMRHRDSPTGCNATCNKRSMLVMSAKLFLSLLKKPSHAAPKKKTTHPAVVDIVLLSSRGPPAAQRTLLVYRMTEAQRNCGALLT